MVKTDSVGFVSCHRDPYIITSDSLFTSQVFLPLTISSGINIYENPVIIGSGYSESNKCSLTSIENNFSASNLINVYPNPSIGIINISGMNSEELSTIKLYNIQGNLIYEKMPFSKINNSITLEVKLPTGIYLLHIIDDKRSYVKKIIIANE